MESASTADFSTAVAKAPPSVEMTIPGCWEAKTKAQQKEGNSRFTSGMTTKAQRQVQVQASMLSRMRSGFLLHCGEMMVSWPPYPGKVQELLMRKLLLVVCVLGVPCAGLAQMNQTAWTSLNTLRPGQKIQVVDVSSKKHSGVFESVSDSAIVFSEKTGEQSVQKQDVRAVKLMENKHRLRNTLIVGAAGAGVGAAIGAATYKGCSSPSFCLDIGGRALPAGIGAVIGGVGGVVVGVLLPSRETVYDVGPH
jgi:hypothetical protein